jgi:DNA-binding XRE family transcriptional regulator
VSKSISAVKYTFLQKLIQVAIFVVKRCIEIHLETLIHTLKARREMLQVTQETLAELSGVALRTVKQLESGKGNPTLQTLQKLTDVLGMEVCIQIKKIG